MPASVAPEGFQAHQGFVSRTTPKLSWSLETTLILTAGRLHRPAALRFPGTPRRIVIHPFLVTFQIVQFGFHRLTLFLTQPFGHSAQIVEQRGNAPAFEFFKHRLDPSPRSRFILRMQSVRHRP